jgi:multidrug resistance efflux pump
MKEGKMKRLFKIYFLGLSALIFIVGCSTTQELKTSITSKVSSITSTVDPAIVKQVPADKQEGFAQAEFDLNVANQKVKLAEQKSELAATQKKYAGLEEDLANNFQKEAEIDYELVKIEAIINSDLGKKEDNRKIKANLQSKKLEVQADRIKINANLEATKGKIDSLTSETAKMDEAIKAMKFDDGKKPESITNEKK